MILIVTFEDNEHVEEVLPHLSCEYVLFNTGWYPEAVSLSAAYRDDGEVTTLTLPDGRVIDTERIRGVWYRRERPYKLHEELTDETAVMFAWSESREALLGLFYSLDCPWMNPPLADEKSQRKMVQLSVAREVGLRIPHTVITNEPATARGFIESFGYGNVIRKAFRNIPQAPRSTHVITAEDMDRIDTVRFAPVTFQEYIEADIDLRVTVVGDEVHAAEITSTPEYAADYRMGLGSANVVAHDLPDKISAQLLELMDRLDLVYGAIDLRRTPEGQYVFLEVNPAGEYRFASNRTGQPVPQAIATVLNRWGAAG